MLTLTLIYASGLICAFTLVVTAFDEIKLKRRRSELMRQPIGIDLGGNGTGSNRVVFRKDGEDLIQNT